MVFESVCNAIPFHTLNSPIVQETKTLKLWVTGPCGLESKIYDSVQWSTGSKILPRVDDPDYECPLFIDNKGLKDLYSSSSEDSAKLSWLAEKYGVSSEAPETVIENQNEEEEDDIDDGDELEEEALYDYEDTLVRHLEELLQEFDERSLDQSGNGDYSVEDIDSADEDEDGGMETDDEDYYEECEQEDTYITYFDCGDSHDEDAYITQSDCEYSDDDECGDVYDQDHLEYENGEVDEEDGIETASCDHVFISYKHHNEEPDVQTGSLNKGVLFVVQKSSRSKWITNPPSQR